MHCNLSKTSTGIAYNYLDRKANITLVFIHGIGLTQNIWDEFIPHFTKYNVLTYDMAGHGASALPEHKPSLHSLAQDLLGLLEELMIVRCVLIGFSLGGMLNRKFAIDYSDKVIGLVIMNSPHERTPAAQKLVEQRANDSQSGPESTIDATLIRWFTPTFLQNNKKIVAQTKQLVLANDRQNFAYFRQLLATGVKELISPQPPICKPTLVITCENDISSTPQMSIAIANEIQNSELAIIAGLQHLGLLEQPQKFITRIIQFLITLTV